MDAGTPSDVGFAGRRNDLTLLPFSISTMIRHGPSTRKDRKI
jgi:hypothetical protein